MSVDHRVLKNLNLVISYFWGDLSSSDIFQHSKFLRQCQELRPAFKEIAIFNIDPESLDTPSSAIITASKMEDKERSFGRFAAVITDNPEVKQMIHFYGRTNPENSHNYRFFSTVESAIQFYHFEAHGLEIINTVRDLEFLHA